MAEMDSSPKDIKKVHSKDLEAHDVDSSDRASVYTVGKQLALEAENQIQYRTCSWQKTTALLFSEYICLALLSFPWSFSVLGMVPGVLVTIAVAAIVQYTSWILWKFCMKYPEARDVCDIGRILFGDSKVAYHLTGVMFILNNTFIQGLHCLVGAKLLNTLTGGGTCTIIWSFLTALICFVISLPRTLDQLSFLGLLAAATMFISFLLAVIFSGIQDVPAGYSDALGAPLVSNFPAKGTTYVDGMSAFLNISYTFIGQITLPSFIAEMKNPNDFPKALTAVTICEIIVFTICGAVMYSQIGAQYMTSPVVGSLQRNYKIIAFSFAIPTIVYLGSLYASVTARYIFFRVFPSNSKHRTSNTAFGWATWTGIIAATWVLAFIIAEIIPFFSDLLSLMSSVFDCWFGFIFWGMAYLIIYPASKRWQGPWRSLETVFNYFLILFGAYMLVAGTYTSVKSILISYAKSQVGGVFSCASNAV